ncbi:ATP-dependent helicase [Bifidobacterium callimiconis]|uniref:ATP-dependent helicase n=1 Tax=Bifidobacterium callimiconis TaxID=2306973 RepID=UPI001BDD5DBC|nr:ATP-dependent helicase [Bifidobacterium callimiconis]MBT1176842.1 ATP-dependent helicase [Bifidobacterium callimiconis]
MSDSTCPDWFTPETRDWFTHAFGAPTVVQAQAWDAIHSGSNVLVTAPTGSGKTLAAFLSAIDALARQETESGTKNGDDAPAASATPRQGVRILYISPLKALGTDVAKNLRRPLDGIAACFEQAQHRVPRITVGMRNGDSTPQERRAIVSHPPDILVTTPESLYLLLTSKARRILTTVTTVIVDEVHALVGTKRGVHLTLSLERLALLAGEFQRIGLSATIRPLDTAAGFLAGTRPVSVIAPQQTPSFALRIINPADDLHDITSLSNANDDDDRGSVWPKVEQAILDDIIAHHTTLVFVNSRGLCEKLTARLNDLYAERIYGRQPLRYRDRSHYDAVAGSSTMLVHDQAPEDVIAMAHHGSVSKERRHQVESDLKAGRLRCVVATSSLELGIDMGTVDLVIQVSPPFSVSSALQRAGRADHRVNGTSHARFYPLTREQVLITTATVEAMRAGRIEQTTIPTNPLDILAQQTVAAAAMEPLDHDTWYRVVRRAAPYHTLDETSCDATIGMMSGQYNGEEFSVFRPSLIWDRDTGIISARPGAQRLAVTCGGTIPDRGTYSVVLTDEAAGKGPKRVGELDEEMVYESRVGDVITLGTSTWRIREITHDRVIVTPAPGQTARLPFWHGDGPGRDADSGETIGRITRELTNGLDNEHGLDGRNGGFDTPTLRRLHDDGLDGHGLDGLARLLDEQRAVTGTVPNDRTLVIERCQDEDGDWRVIIHSPYGRRIHEPWAMGINMRLRARYGYDGQTMAADDGIVLRVPDTDEPLPWRSLIVFDPDELEADIRRHITETALFAARFRENAARSLFMPRMNPSRRVPLWQQRLRAAQLQTAASVIPGFPLILETARECLQDIYDMAALRRMMTALADGRIAVASAQTPVPSPFARALLFGYTGAYMYQYDVPQAERAAATLALDPELLARLLGDGGAEAEPLLDAQVIKRTEAELQCMTAERRKHGKEGVADLLRLLGPLSEHDIAARLRDGESAGEYVAQLQRERRAVPLPIRGITYWAAPDDARRIDEDPDDLILRYAGTHGPFTAETIAERFGLHIGQTRAELNDLTREGRLLRGGFGMGADDDDHDAAAGHGIGNTISPSTESAPRWLHPKVFRMLRRRSLNKARASIRPVSPAAYQEFLAERMGPQSVGCQRYEGPDGLYDVIGLLEGVSLPADMWESSIFPSRVRDYHAGMLDDLLTSGDVFWVGSTAKGTGKNPGRSIAWYLSDSPLSQDNVLSGDWSMVPEALRDGDSCYARQLKPDDMTDAAFLTRMRALMWNGMITCSSFMPVRLTLGGPAKSSRTSSRRRRTGAMAIGRRFPGRARPTVLDAELPGLWSLTFPVPPNDGETDTTADAEAEMITTRRVVDMTEALLDRYGVVSAPLIEMIGLAGGFSGIYPVLRRMEDRGDVIRGMFVEGFGAAQFARRETVDSLRATASERDDHSGRSHDAMIAMDALDPANLFGAMIPWPEPMPWPDAPIEPEAGTMLRPTRREGAVVVISAGRAILYATPRSHHVLVFSASDTVPQDGTAETGEPAYPSYDDDLLRRAFGELAYALRSRSRSTTLFCDVNGMPLTRRNPFWQVMHAAGFSPSPQGLKIYP